MKWYYKYGFSSGQYKGLVLILALNAIFITYYLLDNFSSHSNSSQDYSEFLSVISEMEKPVISSKKDSFFSFNPNTVSIYEMEKLGLENKLATRIQKYRDKGGEFKKSRDLLNIYGIDSSWYYRIESFISIPKKEKTKKRNKNVQPFKFDPNMVSENDLIKMNLPQPVINSWLNYLKSGGEFKTCDDLNKLYTLDDELFAKIRPYCFMESKKEIVIGPIDLNLADSVKLLELKGIGPTYAGRIVRYRNRLGGFVSQKQLLEVYGMDVERIKQFQDEVFLTEVKIKVKYVNTDSFKVLLRHPYLNYNQVKSIVNFREAVQGLKSVDELINLEGFEAIDAVRLKPYLSFEIKN